MVCKLCLVSLEVILQLLELLCARGLFLLKHPQVGLRVATMFGGHRCFSKCIVMSRSCVGGFFPTLCSGGLGLAPGLLGCRLNLEPCCGEPQTLPDDAFVGISEVLPEPMEHAVSID